MNDIIEQIEAQAVNNAKKEIPTIKVGDQVRVLMKIKEQDRERLHPFEGRVIAKKGRGIRQTYTVRRMTYGEGIEFVFPVYSPTIDKMEVIGKPKRRLRRAKIYYVRKLRGKKSQI